VTAGDDHLLRNVTREVLAELLPGLLEEALTTPAAENGNGHHPSTDKAGTAVPQVPAPPVAAVHRPPGWRAPEPAAPATATPATAKPAGDGTLTVAQTGDPGFLAINSVGIDTYNVSQHIFDSLFRFDANAQPVPGLAESWSTSADGLTWSFKLRRGVKFHNGEDFTSEPVKYSIAKRQEDKSPRRVFLTAVKEVRTPDELTAEIVTTRPAPSLPIYIAQIIDIYPPKYMAQAGDDEFNKKPVGTGLYKFVDWQRDQQVTLEASKSYFGGAPAYDKLVMRFIPEPSTRVAELLAGNVQVINFPPIQQLDQIASSGQASARTLRAPRFIT